MRYSSKEEAQQDHIKNYRSNGVAKGKGTLYSSDYPRVKFIVDSIPENTKILDVGCNAGTLGIHLLHKGCYVKGIDIVKDLVVKACRNGIYAFEGEAEYLHMFYDDEFDHVICSEVLEHLYDPMPAIKEAYRVLKDGGKYICTVPHPSSCMVEGGKGDYHQLNFSMEILDTLLHRVFKKDSVTFVELPYQYDYCLVNNIDPKRPQWLGLEAIK